MFNKCNLVTEGEGFNVTDFNQHNFFLGYQYYIWCGNKKNYQQLASLLESKRASFMLAAWVYQTCWSVCTTNLLNAANSNHPVLAL